MSLIKSHPVANIFYKWKILASLYRALLTRIVLSTPQNPSHSSPTASPSMLVGFTHPVSVDRTLSLICFIVKTFRLLTGRGSVLHDATLMSHCRLLVICKPRSPSPITSQDAPVMLSCGKCMLHEKISTYFSAMHNPNIAYHTHLN